MVNGLAGLTRLVVRVEVTQTLVENVKTLKMKVLSINDCFPDIQKRISLGKRLTKFDMAYQIGHFDATNAAHLYVDVFRRDEIVNVFNKIFNTNIK